MNSTKQINTFKIVTFVLLAVLLVCTVGFAVNGWQGAPEDEPESGENGGTTDNTDENTDGTPPSDDSITDGNGTKPPITEEPPAETPKFYSQLTGEEITEERFNTTPLGFVLDPSAPLYGISNSDMTFEFPTEDGGTRLLSYTSNSSPLFKIGALTATRSFISEMSKFFGGIVISYGNDDVVKYSAWDASKTELDLSKYSDSYYIENTLYIYTEKDLVTAAAAHTSTLTGEAYKNAPYDFASTADKIYGTSEANRLSVPYSDSIATEFYYSEASEKYLYFKSGNRKTDMLTGKNISFTNLFILFANATTYEKAEGTELVIDTVSGGKGYYASMGKISEIRWSLDENGELIFRSLNGEKLTVNRGNAYVGYYKASESSRVTFE